MPSQQQKSASENVITFATDKVSASDFVSANILTSMNYIAGAFALQTADFKNVDGWKDLKQGDECTISIDNTIVLTGYIDVIHVTYDKDIHSFIIRGRDKTGLLVDSSNASDTSEWKNISLSSLLTNLCSPFDISVVFDTTATSLKTTVIEKFVANEGETVYKLISDLLLDFGLLPISKGDGKLTITKSATSEKATDMLDIDTNIASVEYISDNTDRFKTYNVKGVGIGSDNKSELADFIQPGSSFVDNVINTEKTCTVFCENPVTLDQCQKRAAWEASIRAGESRVFIYEVGGLIQNDGKPWRFNTLVDINDTLIDFIDTLLIKDVEFTLDDDGTSTLITTVDKNTYSGSLPTVRYPYD